MDGLMSLLFPLCPRSFPSFLLNRRMVMIQDYDKAGKGNRGFRMMDVLGTGLQICIAEVSDQFIVLDL